MIYVHYLLLGECPTSSWACQDGFDTAFLHIYCTWWHHYLRNTNFRTKWISLPQLSMPGIRKKGRGKFISCNHTRSNYSLMDQFKSVERNLYLSYIVFKESPPKTSTTCSLFKRKEILHCLQTCHVHISPLNLWNLEDFGQEKMLPDIEWKTFVSFWIWPHLLNLFTPFSPPRQKYIFKHK